MPQWPSSGPMRIPTCFNNFAHCGYFIGVVTFVFGTRHQNADVSCGIKFTRDYRHLNDRRLQLSNRTQLFTN